MPLPEDPIDRCGYAIFSLPSSHEFSEACSVHDETFLRKGISRNLADTRLLKDMLKIAKDKKSLKLKLQAYIFYGIARTFGKLFW